ncbi:hypothetical protein LguiA_028822 [Lonicera macranthoides]
MGRRPCCSKEDGLNRGAWTAMEDKILRDYITIHGEGKWRNLPKMAGLRRCGKSCRLRWLNYLRPGIKRGNITHDEEDLIIRLHNLLGNRWSLIAGRLPGRTDNEIKNYWNTNMIKKAQGHQPITTPASNSKTSNESKQKQIHLSGGQKQNSPTSCVVRTKASRCTKVFVTQQPENIQPLDTKLVVVKQNTDASTVPPEPYSGASPYDFTTDHFEMDEKLLSNFLDIEFAALSELIDGLEGDNKTNISADLSSSDSNQRLCFPQEKLHDMDLGSMASLIDPDMNWLQD